MAITSTQSKVPASVTNIAVGRYIDTGTVAAFKITCGFKPRYVKVQNLAASAVTFEWFEGMTAAYALKTAVAGDKTIVTTNGITVAADGFTLGLDTSINITNEQLSWIAIG
jgi:hypothetical protein